MTLIEKLHIKRLPARLACGGIYWNRSQRPPRTAFDPATGAYVFTAEGDLIIRKAMRRAARRIALRLLLRYPRLQFEYFALKIRYARLRLLRYLLGYLAKPRFYRHDPP